MASVFISYSHDSDKHKRWVGELVQDLRQQLNSSNVDFVFDQSDLKPGQDMARFMERGISDSDYVLVICTSNYNQKADSGHGGVGYEKMIITSELLTNQDTHKFIPIVRNVMSARLTPLCLSTRLYVDLSDNANYDTGINEVCNVLGQTLTEPSSKSLPKGWSFDKEGKDPLIKGQKRQINHPDGRKETFQLIDNKIVCVEQVFIDGAVAYYEVDPNGNIIRQKFPYSVAEYAILINQASLLAYESNTNSDGNIEYRAELKWGRTVRWLTDAKGVLLDYHLIGGCHVDHKQRQIRCGW